MLNQNELNAYADRHGLTPTARAVVRHIRTSAPSRRVSSSKANVSSRYASVKMGCVIQAESHHNELAAVIGWDYDERTYEFYDQPPQIKLSWKNRNGHRYSYLATPDYFILQEGFVGWVECKTEDWLKAKAAEGSGAYVCDEKGLWHHLPGEAYAAELGMQFKLRSSKENDWTAIRNTEFISDYLDVSAPIPSPAELQSIAKLFTKKSWIRLKDLLEGEHGVTTDIIFSMIARHELHVQLDRDLLSEPERTKVFRDTAAAKAYQLYIEGGTRPTIPAHQSITLEIGAMLLWDCTPHRISNISNERIYLEEFDDQSGPQDGLKVLKRPDFEGLVKQGIITGPTVTADLDWKSLDNIVKHASPLDLELATLRYRNLFPERSDGKSQVFAPRTLRKLRASYRQSEAALGSGFVGLLPKTHKRGNRERKIHPDVIAIMDLVIDERYAHSTRRTVTACWGEVRLRCREQGVEPPSEKTFRAQIKRRYSYGLLVAREGEKAAYNEEEYQWYLGESPPRHGERPFQYGHIDHTELDMQFVASRKGESLGKAWLSAMIDPYDHDIQAWTIQFEEPSYRSCMAVIRDCLKRHGRLPSTIVVDKGKEFSSTYFEQMLAFFEVSKKTRPSAKPRFGAMIERFFGVTNKQLIHNLIGNNQALQKPRTMSRSHDPRRLAVWDLPAFTDAFENYLDKVYRTTERSGLGMSVNEAIRVAQVHCGARAHKLIPYNESVGIICLPSTAKGTAKVQAGRGIKINYQYYWTAEFSNIGYRNQEVKVRYDPDDLSAAYAWLGDHWATCRSEFASAFLGRSEKEIATASKEIRARDQRAGIRRKFNAEIIADFLRATDGQEKVMATAKKHRESMAAKGRTSRPADPVDAVPSSQDWDKAPFEFYGEFQ